MWKARCGLLASVVHMFNCCLNSSSVSVFVWGLLELLGTDLVQTLRFYTVMYRREMKTMKTAKSTLLKR